MDLRVNKGFAIGLVIIILMISFTGLPIIGNIFNVLYPDNAYNISFADLAIANLKLTFSNLSEVIIGLWLFYIAERSKQDKWTWLLIGLTFGEYGLILFGMLILFKNIKSTVDLFNSLKPILILLIIAFILNISSRTLLAPYLTVKMDVGAYSFILKYTAYLSSAIYTIVILMHIVLALKLNLAMKKLNVTNKSVWIIATLFLGLFPIIVFNELMIINKGNS